MHLIPKLNGSICRHSGTYYWKTILLAFIIYVDITPTDSHLRYDEMFKINNKPEAWWVTEPHKSSLVWSRNFIVLHKSPTRVQKHYPAQPSLSVSVTPWSCNTAHGQMEVDKNDFLLIFKPKVDFHRACVKLRSSIFYLKLLIKSIIIILSPKSPKSSGFWLQIYVV